MGSDSPISAGKWHTSSFSGTGGQCVEVSIGETISVRDTKDRNGPMLTFSHAEWAAFLAGVHSQEFGLPEAVK